MKADELDDLKAEIERLKVDLEAQKRVADKFLADLQIQTRLAGRYMAELFSAQDLLTELADALENHVLIDESDKSAGFWHQHYPLTWALIQRARVVCAQYEFSREAVRVGNQ